MNINTERLKIRYIKESDFSDIHEYASNREVTKYMLWGPNLENDTKEFIHQTVEQYKKKPIKSYEFVIEQNQKVIGGLSMHFNDALNQAEIGWICNPKFWHLGYMTEAASALITYFKNIFSLEKIIATCDDRNETSYKLMERLGMNLVSITHDVRRDKTTGKLTISQRNYELKI